jgi:hypothetical protein
VAASLLVPLEKALRANGFARTHFEAVNKSVDNNPIQKTRLFLETAREGISIRGATASPHEGEIVRVMPIRCLQTFLFFSAILFTSFAPASQSIRDGNWSDPGTWDSPPASDTDVVVQNAVTVDTPSQARLVTVNAGATLTIASTIELWGSLVINGTLQGTTGEIRFHVADDTKFTGNGPAGPDPANPDFHPEDIGLWGMGEVHLTGLEVTSWVNAVPTSQSGKTTSYGVVLLPTITATSANLDRIPNGWQAGDTLVLCATDGGYSLATLTSLSGATITFTTSSASFTADTLAMADNTGTRQYAYPKIANLSRRFVISSADVQEGDTAHRAHAAFMMGGCAQLDFVEFRNLGPRNKLGRYPVHFHKMGDSPCCRVNGCSMWQSVSDPGSRFVAVHNSSSIQVTNNVGLRSRGHGFFSETGEEANNQWTGNLSIDVSSPEELTVKNSRTDSGSHHFWLYDGSTISGNVAVGPKTVPGVIVPPLNATIGLFLQKNTTGKANLPGPTISNCEFFGTGEYGSWSLVTATQYVNPKSLYCGAQFNHDTGFPPLPMVISNPLFAFNGVGGVSPYRCQIYFNAGVPSSHLVQINGGVLVGEILIHAHYHAIANFQNVNFAGANLVGATYWQCVLLLQNCNFNVSQFAFAQNYLPHQEEPGLLRVTNGTGLIGNETILIGQNKDFSKNENARFPGLAGTSVVAGSIRLNSLAPQTGMIARPPTGDAYPQAEQWSVDVAGKAPSIMRQGDPFRLVQPQWQASLAAGTNGYPYGFPPGTYDVRITQKDGSIKTYLGIKVVAGKVTQIP